MVTLIVIGSVVIVGTIAFFIRRHFVKKSKDETLLSPETAWDKFWKFINPFMYLCLFL